MNTAFDTVTSADGTTIAFEQAGDGPPIILIGGAFNDRSTVTALAATLAPDATAVAYDRRGRGDSVDNSGSSAGGSSNIEREIEDLMALIDRLGGSAALFGHSSGANLALEAAMGGASVTKVVAYEPAFVVDETRPRPSADIGDRLRALLALGQRDDAVALFMSESVGVPAEMVEGMRAGDSWAFLVRLAHTLPYDVAVCGPGLVIPRDRLAKIDVPVLAINGSESWPWIAASTHAVADAIPGARHVSLEGQDHSVLHNPAALRPVIVDFVA
jgi:pimeloyl-ACP methyl ester carboxylesterase